MSALDPIPFERRSGDRWRVRGSTMASFFDADGDVTLTRVELVDASPTGLGIKCPIAPRIGSRITIYADPAPVPHRTGLVAGCRRSEDGFRVGLRCDQRAAA